MCCFSGPVEVVRNTRIFARMAEDRQTIVYQMNFKADNELAMILPIPVAVEASEDAVNFIDLSDCADFFEQIDTAFPNLGKSRGMENFSMNDSLSATVLKVHEVGDFEASYVPTLDDFDRLDERFKLPRQTWEQLPQYADYGFAVFKLAIKPKKRYTMRYEEEPHPMAFTFPTATPHQLFIPTVHIHDGKVHATEEFDHTLYAQVPVEAFPMVAATGWRKSAGPLGEYMNAYKAKNVFDPSQVAFKRAMHGSHKNEDQLVGIGMAHEGATR